MLVCPYQRSHLGEVFVLAAVAGSGFSQLLWTALAQEEQGHTLPQCGVGSLSLPTREIQEQPEPRRS